MTFRLLLLTIFTLSILSSCSKVNPLDCELTILDHSTCEDNVTVLHIKIEGGQAPYVFQIKNKFEKSIVHSQLSDEPETMIYIENANDIFYELHVIDDALETEVAEFEIRPSGSSEFTDVLELETENGKIALNNVAVLLYNSENEIELMEKTTTDSQGAFTFENIPTGIYSIKVDLNEKYNRYKLVSDNDLNDRIKIKAGSKETIPFIVNCRLNQGIDLSFVLP